MTKQEAIENHRKMWNWIADETLKRERKVRKEEYFITNTKIEPPNIKYCYACTYNFEKLSEAYLDDCRYCPIKFPGGHCLNSEDSPYNLWVYSFNYKETAKYAREIAELPERRNLDE